MTDEDRVQTLVVGGGLGGLAAAMFLAEHGVDCLLVERHRRVSHHPRARGITPRVMELMRQAGLEERIRDTGSGRALARNSGVIAAKSLAGPQFGALRELYVMDIRADLSRLTPAGWCLCHQDEFEPLLREQAEKNGARVEFGTEMLSFRQDDRGVTAELRGPGGAVRTVSADYLVAADGPAGGIREVCGIPVEGTAPLGHFMNIHFSADLAEQLGDRRFVMCYVANEGVRGALMPIDNRARWLLHVLFDPRTEDPAAFDDDRCRELVRAATGVPDLAVDVHGALPWESVGRTAGRFREGRVFLVGDAAHLMPPSGAFGSNTAIQDGHNLAWKLAAVLRGDAGPGLLDTYDAERRPTCVATVEQAVLRSLDRPRLVGEEPPPVDPRIVPDTTVWFGSRYHSSAVQAGDEPSGSVWAADCDGTPGVRAPHLQLRRDGGTISALDLYHRELVLLTGSGGADWRAAAARIRPGRGVAPRVHEIGPGGLTDLSGGWAAAHGVTDDGAVLVRPDGVVAWRSRGSVADPDTALGDAVARVLSVN